MLSLCKFAKFYEITEYLSNKQIAMLKKINLTAIVIAMMAILALPVSAQNSKKNSKKQDTKPQTQQTAPQRVSPTDGIKEVIDRIFTYIDGCTPAQLVDAEGKELTDFSKIDRNTSFKKGDFGINTYEWGVTYSGLLLASEVTGEQKYAQYVYDRFNFLGQIYPYVKKYTDETGYTTRLNSLYNPRFLDDCGAMTAAMIKATLKNPMQARQYRGLLDNWFNFCMYKEYRFGNGILARNRPTTNSVWLDDMYMGITPIAFRGKLSQAERGDLTQKFYSEAINQVLLFKNYLWIPEKGMYRHGWIEGMAEHPDYHWARANGWAMLTMCDVLDAIPERVQDRDKVLETLKTQIKTIAALQSPEGTWHQLLDKTETYLETSASAMYVYCIAHAINQGWIDRTAYQDIAKTGWEAVAKQVNEKGQVENTCTGTGLGWTNTFYARRPVSVYAAHGYGPVLLAAAEMLKLYSPAAGMRPGQAPQGAPNFNTVNVPSRFGKVQRQEGKPMVFLAGDSTCMNGSGNGASGLWGWGSFFGEYLTDDVVVDNEAVGGLSSRTFFNSVWPNILGFFKEGDFVLIQFGHNDTAPLNTGRARGTLDGTGDKPQTVVMEKNGGPEDVYSYGHYLRMMVRQAKLRGVTPIILSPTPSNSWKDDKTMNTYANRFAAWCKEVAEQEGVEYVDVNALGAAAYEKIGKEDAQKIYFADSVHTHEKGARLYCEITAKGLKDINSSMSKYVK